MILDGWVWIELPGKMPEMPEIARMMKIGLEKGAGV